MKSLKCLVISFIVVSQLHAQVDVGTYVDPSYKLDLVIMDTVTLARNCAYQKEFQKADELLTAYNANHTDFYGLSLHALVLYWMQSFDRSTALYEKAINLFPQPSSLYLDYARVLYGLNKLSKASKLLDTYRQYDSANAEAQIMTAYMKLWNGRLAQAGSIAKDLLKKYPTNTEATDIVSKINNWTIPYVKAGTQIISDDQPLKGNEFYAEGGVYKSWLFAPTAQASIYHYSAGDSSFHSMWLQLSNAIQVTMKTRLKLKAGVFAQNGNGSSFAGGASLSQQIAHHFSLEAAYDRRPYQYTITSVKHMVMENLTSFGLNYNRNDKWFGKAGYDLYKYADGNKANVEYLWLLAPVVSLPHFSFSAGYAFRHADALKSTFTSKESLTEIINNWPPVNGIAGYYDPYFTPENQVAHSALINIKVRPFKKVQFSSGLNIAFSARADNPYLYVDSHDNGLFINSGFAKVSYTPTIWTNELMVAASNKLSIVANYTYDKLLYYKGHRAGIELKYAFLK